MTSKKHSSRARSGRWQDRDPQFKSESRRYEEPIPSRALILAELAAAGEMLGVRELAKRFGLRKVALVRALESRLNAMNRDGALTRTGRASFGVAGESAELTGSVSAHRDGYGWFTPAEGGTPDVHLDQSQMAGVMHGDRLRIRITADDGRGRRSGAVLEVLERRTRELAGRFDDAGDVAFVTPESPRFRQRVMVPASARGTARQGDLVVVELTGDRSRFATPVGKVIRVVETRNAADLATELAIVTHGLPNVFPEPCEREARAWGDRVRPEDIAGREDLRGLPLVTIDGEDARDFDDAVYCEPHAAAGGSSSRSPTSVTTCRQDGALDAEARGRATSVYFPDRVVPMLPEALSNGLCSLKPQVDRLCLVCDMQVDAQGEVGRARFYAAVMRSRRASPTPRRPRSCWRRTRRCAPARRAEAASRASERSSTWRCAPRAKSAARSTSMHPRSRCG